MKMKKLKEAKEMSEDLRIFIEKAKNQRYFRKLLKEAKLEGDITDETDDTCALGIVYDQIITCIEKYEPLEFFRQFSTNKSSLVVPLGTHGVASEITAGEFTNSPKTVDCTTIDLDKEYGIEISWTRAHIEDATWDVLSEQNQTAGYAITLHLADLGATALEAIAAGNLAGGAVVAISDPITWAEFLEVVSQCDIEGTGPADFVLVTPKIYWQLLALDQFVNSLYAGSDEVMRSGIAKTMFGTTVIRHHGLTADNMFALNSRKAIALVYRRHMTVEPYEHPETNEYGFIASVRAKVKVLCENAVARGTVGE